ncbi:MAG: LysR family transcriptional regulator [Halioglobus sp.]
MRFKSLDLNLLVALDVLLDEQNVTRAAERLNISQPAMSAALSRLREHFNEPLLVLHSKRMIPTPAALEMREPLKELLQDAELLVTKTTRFDPATSERRFRIVTSDYMLTVVFPALAEQLELVAPGVTMECFQPSEHSSQLLEQGDIDLVFAPENHLLSEHPSELMFEEKYVVVGWKNNPALEGNIVSEDEFFSARHVTVEIGESARSSFAESHLRNLNRERRIDMKVSSFLTAPEIVVNTMKLTVMHERLAKLFAQRIDITIAELPFDFPTMREMVQFHAARKHDSGVRWLIDRAKELA